VVGVLLEEYGRRMTPALLWEEIYSLKRFGVKSGAGFYNYKGQENNGVLDGILKKLRPQAPSKKAPFSANRLLLSMINEAALCLQEKVSSPTDIDVAVLAGIGFPQPKGGLLQYADTLGIDVILKELETLYQLYGDRFFPAPLLKRMVHAGFLGKKTKRGFLEYTG
jgi:3-hydroxyacyl-CoA dehydrogenase